MKEAPGDSRRFFLRLEEVLTALDDAEEDDRAMSNAVHQGDGSDSGISQRCFSVEAKI